MEITNSPDAPAFLMVAAGLSAWAASNPGTVPSYAGYDIYNGGNGVEEGIYRVLAAFPVVVAITYCHQQERKFVAVNNPSNSVIENMLVMMGQVDAGGRPSKKAVHVLNKLWILFADHEMTNSTAAFLNAASAHSDPLSSCVASVASGNGPLHGGAIDLAYKSFEQLKDKEGVKAHMANVRDKKCRLMGVGHRVYRTVDPRLQYIRSLMAELETSEAQSPLLEVAMEIDRTVSEDPYFTKRKLSINADLYGSFVYAAL